MGTIFLACWEAQLKGQPPFAGRQDGLSQKVGAVGIIAIPAGGSVIRHSLEMLLGGGWMTPIYLEKGLAILFREETAHTGRTNGWSSGVSTRGMIHGVVRIELVAAVVDVGFTLWHCEKQIQTFRNCGLPVAMTWIEMSHKPPLQARVRSFWQQPTWARGLKGGTTAVGGPETDCLN